MPEKMKKNMGNFLLKTVLAFFCVNFAGLVFFETVFATNVNITLIAPPTSITVTPNPGTVIVGNQIQYHAVAHYADQPDLDITNNPGTIWTTVNHVIATTNSVGLVSGVIVGSTDVRATFSYKTGSAVINVIPTAMPISISITPALVKTVVGDSFQYTARAHYSDGSSADITNNTMSVWSSDNLAVGTINSTGNITAVAVGSSNVRITYLGLTATAQFMATLVPTPITLTVTPATATVTDGHTQQYVAVATFTGYPTLDVTANPSTSWTRANPAIASINATGVATGLTLGTTGISATYLGVTGSAILNVVTPVSIYIVPPSVSANEGTTYQLQAYVRYSDGHDVLITTDPLSAWSTSNDKYVTVNTTGFISLEKKGSALITVTYRGLSASATVTVNKPPHGGGGNPPTPPVTPPGPPPVTPPVEPPVTPPGPPPVTPPVIPPVTPPVIPPVTPPVTPPVEVPPPPPVTPPPEVVVPPPATPEEPPRQPAPVVFFPGPPPPGEEEVTSALPRNASQLYQEKTSTPPFIPPELSISRGEAVTITVKEFMLAYTKRDLLKSCAADIYGCLSIFLNVTKYDKAKINDGYIFETGVNIPSKVGDDGEMNFDFPALQLYPDVPFSHIYSYYVNISTFLAIVQGYYADPSSPFKPDRIITRVESLKVLLGAINVMKWLYYDELEAKLGGPNEVRSQMTPFADVNGLKDYTWWYSRYVNKACEIDIIDCTYGSNYRPDEFVTRAEFLQMVERFKNFVKTTDYTKELEGDADGDGIKNYLEDNIYFTLSKKADTDDDGLNDYEELFTYKTSPFVKDSDGDLLSDGDEVKVYKTNPLQKDTDGDGFTDYVEAKTGTDPLDINSYPADTLYAGVADAWQTQYSINIQSGEQDSDFDGITDALEYQYGTNPLLSDTDGDGFSDAQEILDFGTDPLVPNTKEEIAQELKITGFQENQLISTSLPLIRGIAPLNSTVRIFLRNDYGHEKAIGDVLVTDGNMFILQVDQPIRDGRYAIVAKAMDASKKSVRESPPVHIVIDSTLGVKDPVPKRLSDAQVSADIILKNLRVEIRDKRPVLIGETEYGNKVTANWKSIVTTSILIADAISGQFSIMSPTDLGLGKHEVYVMAIRKKDGAVSKAVRLDFVISPQEETVADQIQLRGVFESNAARYLPLPVVRFLEFNWRWIILFFILIILMVIIRAYYCFIFKRRKDRDDEKNVNKPHLRQ